MLDDVLALGGFFPRLRPRDPAFEVWLDRHASSDPSRELLEEALSQLPDAECAAIVQRLAAERPDVWVGIDAEFDDAAAERLLVIGAVAAALREERLPDQSQLALLDELEELRADALEVLALAIDPCALWSLVEAVETGDELAPRSHSRFGEAIAAEVRARWSADHRERLDFLVERLRRQLPIEGHPLASDALAAACAAYAAEPAIRDTLPALLLEDALVPAGLLAQLAA